MKDIQPATAIDAFLSRIGAFETLCVAVSGGSDSTALLHLLHEHLKDGKRPRLVAVTIDHGLRTSSGEEAARVAAFCEARKIEHRIMRWAGHKPESGLQDAARNARYELLREAAKSLKTNAVVTAHTRDDQIETIRMRQRRGMGRGLSGMAEAVLFRRDCWILRPLLNVRRSALQAVLADASIDWVDDPSNRDRRFERVRIRLDESNPAADGELLSMVEAMAQARRSDGERLARFLHDNVIIHADMIAELPQVPEGLVGCSATGSGASCGADGRACLSPRLPLAGSHCAVRLRKRPPAGQPQPLRAGPARTTFFHLPRTSFGADHQDRCGRGSNLGRAIPVHQPLQAARPACRAD